MENSRVGAMVNEKNEAQDGDETEEDAEEVEDEIDAEAAEAAPIKIARDPGDPTPGEREIHNITHIPYRSWCSICVIGRGQEESHFRQKEGEVSCKPCMSFDYKSFGQEGDYDDKATAMVAKDDKFKMKFAHICEKKGSSDKWIIDKIIEDIDRLGHTEVILKGDGEPALQDVLQEVKRRRVHPTLLQGPPAYDPQANGAAEKAVQDYMGQLRTMKIGLEARLKCKVESDWSILQWTSELAPELTNRCQVGRDGRTAYYRLLGKDSKKGMVEIGEQVMAKPLRGKKSNRKMSLKDRWVFATWVGIDARTNEHIVVLGDGGAAIRVRTVLRRPASDRWNPEAIKNIRATPRTPNPADEDQGRAQPECDTRTRKIEVDGEGADIKMDYGKDQPAKNREFKITKSILDKFKFTAGCKGCDAVIHGSGARAHSDGCRKRLEEAIKNDDVLKVRLDMRDIRMNKKVVADDVEKKEEVDEVEKIDVEMKTDEAEVAGELLQDKSNIIDAQVPGQSSSSSKNNGDKILIPVISSGQHGPVDGPKAEASSSSSRKREKDGEHSTDETLLINLPKELEKEQDNKRRRLRVLASEKRLLGRVSRNYGTGSERRKLNAMLNHLEWNRGVESQETFDRRMDISSLIGALDEEISPHDEAEEMERWRMMYDGYDFFDDMNEFKKMDREEVIKARRVEMQFFKNMGVYVKVPRETARRHGCKIITTKWLDTNKGDAQNPNYRSRMVGREIKCDKRMDLFSATPPLETLKMITSICARRQSDAKPCRMAIVDIKRAYFYAKARRPVFIEIPAEDREEGEEGMVGQLQLSLYGTRDAAQNWAAEYTSLLTELGFRIGKASPCNFMHDERNIALTVHGDDFTIAADEEQLKWLGEKMRKRYDLKMDVLGPEAHQQQEVRILNRIIRWTKHGLEYEPDQRHAEKVVSELGLEKSREVSTPCVPELSSANAKKDEKDKKILEPPESTRFRGIAARINYLAADRPDLQFASKGASRYMANPTEESWEVLKRIGRYLKANPRMVQTFEWCDWQEELQGYADSDWAGDKSSYKSTSGGALMWGPHTLKTWATSQSTIALSSGEAELYAMTKMAVQIKGMMSLAADFSMKLKGIVRSDSTAAIGIAYREGLGGRCRHINVQYLWIQERVRSGQLGLSKVLGKNNPADMMTKAVGTDTLQQHLKFMNFRSRAGRAVKASRLLNSVTPSAMVPQSPSTRSCTTSIMRTRNARSHTQTGSSTTN